MSESSKSLKDLLAPVQELKERVISLEGEYDTVKEEVSRLWKVYWPLSNRKKALKEQLDAARLELAKECSKHKELMDLLKSMK
jgi:hypothetical protein